MFVAAIDTLIAICIGVVIVWGWVAFVSEAIARRTGATRRVPYPDDVLWTRCGGALLNLGLFGGGRLHPRNTDLRWRLEKRPMSGGRA